MSLFNILPGFQKTPAGLERQILTRLPRITWMGTALFGALALAARALPWSGSEADIWTSIHTIDIYLIALVILHWTVVLTVGIGAFIVMVMKGRLMWPTPTRWWSQSTPHLPAPYRTRPGARERIKGCTRRAPGFGDQTVPSLWMNTMKRCSLSFTSARRGLLISIGLLAAGIGATAQAQGVVRNFPEAALRGVMEVGQPPWITMDGVTAQLSPGSRIRSTGNSIVMSGGLVGQKLVVNYVLAPGGLVHEVWILTEVEAALKRPRAADLKN